MSGQLDQHIVAELRDIMGDDLGALFDTFIIDTQQKIEELKQKINDGDYDFLRRQAHSLKGSSKNVGANALAAACEQLEIDAKNESVSEPESHLQQITEKFGLVKAEIESL